MITDQDSRFPGSNSLGSNPIPTTLLALWLLVTLLTSVSFLSSVSGSADGKCHACLIKLLGQFKKLMCKAFRRVPGE